MIIYVEAVILDNFCLDFLLAYLTLLLAGQKIRYFPIILSATIGCLFALFYPRISFLGLPLKIVVLLVNAFLFTGKKPLRIYLVNTFVYLLLSFCLSGLLSFLLGGDVSGGFIGVRPGGAVALLSISVFFLLYAVRQVRGLIAERQRKSKYAVAELINRDKKIRIGALYDSGNLLTDRNGESVVVTDRAHVQELGDLTAYGEMNVRTASGSKVLQLVKIPEIKIYSQGKENTLINVTAALSDLPDDYALILPCE